MADKLKAILTEMFDDPNAIELVTTAIAELSIRNIFQEVPDDIVSAQLASAVSSLSSAYDRKSEDVMALTVQKGDELIKEWDRNDETRNTFVEYVNTKYMDGGKVH